MTKPLPCPVCGRVPEASFRQDNPGFKDTHRIECYQPNNNDYHLVEAFGGTKAAAIRRWNKLVGKKA